MAELAQSPLSGLLLTLLAYQGAQWLYLRLGHFPLLHPTLWAAISIAVLLLVSDISYLQYWQGAQWIHFLLGPATVALALPLYQQWPLIRQSYRPLLISILGGSIMGFASAVFLAWMFNIPNALWPSIAPKSATTPIAMSIAETLGGDPGLAALFVVLTGIFGSMVSVSWLHLIRIHDERAQGLALGIAAHGIGTARAVQISPTAAAFAGLGMGFCGLITAVSLPILFHWI